MSLLDLHREKRPRTMVFIDPVHEELRQEKVIDEKGMPSKKTSYVKTCVEDNNKQFTSKDFMIESLDLVGKLGDLKEVKMSNNDAGSFASGVEQMELNLLNQMTKDNEKPVQESSKKE